MPKYVITVLCLLCVSCGGRQIAKEDYSQLATPEETFEFVKKTVNHDDSKAFYYCLASYIQKQVPPSQLDLAWALAGSFFGILLQAELKNVEIPAPDLKNRKDLETAKITVALQKLEAAFLLIREEEKWKIGNPTQYGLPDISKLPQKKRLPWRSMATAYNTNDPSDWTVDEKIDRKTKKQFTKDTRIPWRNEQKTTYIQEEPQDWFSPKKIKRK